MFINFSNHPHASWDSSQTNVASAYGEIIDIPFPSVDPLASEDEIAKIADRYSERIIHMADTNTSVMVQGEFTLTYAVVNRLKDEGIKAVSACSDRDVIESVDENGHTVRKSVFKFKRFREYT